MGGGGGGGGGGGRFRHARWTHKRVLAIGLRVRHSPTSESFIAATAWVYFDVYDVVFAAAVALPFV